jgi:hypothetical protein
MNINPRWFWLNVFIPFAASRLACLIVGLLVVGFAPMQATGWHVSAHNWIDIWARWDSGFYLDIAATGYSYTSGQLSTVAFFPLYPLLMRLITFGSQDHQLLTIVGWLISNVATLAAFALLYRLVALDWDESIAKCTVLYIALFPTSFFFNVVYTEGLFLFLTVAAFYCARQRWWLAAGILGGLSAATRVIGALLVFPLAYEWNKHKPRRWLSPGFLLLVPCGLLAYMFYLKFTFGDPLLFMKAQADWGRNTSLVDIPYLINSLLTVPDLGNRILHAGVDIFLVIISAGLLIALLWQDRKSYQMYAIYAFVIPLLSLQVVSMPRYILVIFPFFIVMAQWLKKPVIFAVTLAIMGVLQAILFARWSLWFWVA